MVRALRGTMVLLLVFSLVVAFASCGGPAPPDRSGEESEGPVPAAGAGPESVSTGEEPPPVQEESSSAPESSDADYGQEQLPEPEPDPGPDATPEPAPVPEAGADASSTPDEPPATEERGDGMTPVTITVGGEGFDALFYDNEAAGALVGRMPLTVTMEDLNRNEKYYHFPEAIHSSATERPDTIRAGEIMCWSGNSLVLFYDTFSNSYGGYVRIGTIEDTSGLASALGPGSVTVTFSTP